MMGIRLNEGLELAGVNVDEAGLRKAVEREWVEVEKGRLGLTKKGRHFCSEVAVLLCP
ncbi:hypothetical protein CCB80_10745 [Armatimonadetes bacterium Uphvl-Ar1]|nr:hypothetical protein CCB80_10745 [Armatimonadetes bacterium Uphvl-Ar1]